MKRILSGITPSGSKLHIGNYFGAVKPQIDFQNSGHQTLYFVSDLHALTTVKDKQVLEDNVRNVILDYLALGIDPEKTIFFRQSDVSEHSELAIVLANYISFAQMQRMHAYKDKLSKGTDSNINMGLFNYPILMAADILLYGVDGVPVGEDQRQHIELARDIAENFNKIVKKEYFKKPEAIISKEVGKIIGTDGKRKMSKSLGNIIGIFEDEAVIRKQIMSCYTDPNRIKATDPGVVEGNPVFVYHDLLNQNKDEISDLKARYLKGTVGDVEVKEKLFKAHLEYFKEERALRKKLEYDPKHIEKILESGKERAKEIAEKTLKEVYEIVGLS